VAIKTQSARGFPAGAIPTVDFLLAQPAAIVKKTGVKTQDWTGAKKIESV
jgi:hypothetical protein